MSFYEFTITDLIVAIFTALTLLYAIYVHYNKSSEENLKRIIKEVMAEDHDKISKLEAKMELIQSFFQKELPSSSGERLHELVELFSQDKLTNPDEIVEMKNLLAKIWKEYPKSHEGFNARLRILAADQKLIDLNRKDLIGSK